MALALSLLLVRGAAAGAVEVEYARGLALDRAFVAMVGPTLAAARGRRAHARDKSPTRRYWESRLLLARAKEVPQSESVDVQLCVEGVSCPLAAEGRLVARAGRFSLWARR